MSRSKKTMSGFSNHSTKKRRKKEGRREVKITMRSWSGRKKSRQKPNTIPTTIMKAEKAPHEAEEEDYSPIQGKTSPRYSVLTDKNTVTMQESVGLPRAKVDEEEKTTLFLAYKGKSKDENTTWYLDIGASNHMCGSRDMFASLDETISENVSFGDD
ncbi:LOW QUALITY PROTEIN: hypothetical protein V2J09_018096 [Rumex salicifolius]